MQDRIKAFKGVANFRDFGGYDTMDGRRVKTGKLYRTAALHEAHADDFAILNSLGVDFQVDLRRQSERVSEPNIWGPHEVHTFNDLGAYKASHLEFLEKGNLTGADAQQFMTAYYAEAPWVESHVCLYTRWFRRLAETRGAGLINCAAGKDRTGIGCALTLSILGVSDEVILSDYLLTNDTIDLEQRLPFVREKWEKRLRLKLDDEALYPFIGVKSEYLQSAINAIHAKHGSLANYSRDILAVDDALIDALKSKLLD